MPGHITHRSVAWHAVHELHDFWMPSLCRMTTRRMETQAASKAMRQSPSTHVLLVASVMIDCSYQLIGRLSSIACINAQEIGPPQSEDTGDSTDWASPEAAAETTSADRADGGNDAGPSASGSSAVKAESAEADSAAGAGGAAASSDASMAEAGEPEDSAGMRGHDAPPSTRMIGGVDLSNPYIGFMSICSSFAVGRSE